MSLPFFSSINFTLIFLGSRISWLWRGRCCAREYHHNIRHWRVCKNQENSETGCSYTYSLDPNPWSWLETKEAAEQMAYEVKQHARMRTFVYILCLQDSWAVFQLFQVAHWKNLGADGIDLDLESGARDQPVGSGPISLIHL